MRRASLLLVGLVAACRREPVIGAGGASDAPVGMPATDKSSVGATALFAPRCHATEQGVLIDDGGGLDNLEIGDGLAYPDGYGVALIHRTIAGRTAAVALLGVDARVARVVDLGPTFGDAPPPRLASCGKELVAAAFVTTGTGARAGTGPDASRDLSVYVVDQRAPQQAISSIPQHRDDSLAFDLACSGGNGLAVWDETTAASPGNAARGVVRAASFEVGQRAIRVRDVSPSDSDAEMPRVVSTGAGFFVLWLARKQETAGLSDAISTRSGRDAGASTIIEVPGEVRTNAWLEMMAMDAAGNASGPLRRLTPTSGHVSAYDVQVRSDKPQQGIIVVARDDGETSDGSGGVLLRVRARVDGVEPPMTLPTNGLGRGAPALVDAPATWLAWVGPNEQIRLLPLDTAGEVIEKASVEEGFNEARPLLSLTSEGRMLVAMPRDRSAQLRVFACQR